MAFVLIVLASVVGYFGALDENPKLIRAVEWTRSSESKEDLPKLIAFFLLSSLSTQYAFMTLLCLFLQLSLNIVIYSKTGPSVALKIIQRDVIAKYNQPDFLYNRKAIERLQQEVRSDDSKPES